MFPLFLHSRWSSGRNGLKSIPQSLKSLMVARSKSHKFRSPYKKPHRPLFWSPKSIFGPLTMVAAVFYFKGWGITIQSSSFSRAAINNKILDKLMCKCWTRLEKRNKNVVIGHIWNGQLAKTNSMGWQ